jgi:hypothetical protein
MSKPAVSLDGSDSKSLDNPGGSLLRDWTFAGGRGLSTGHARQGQTEGREKGGVQNRRAPRAPAETSPEFRCAPHGPQGAI